MQYPYIDPATVVVTDENYYPSKRLAEFAVADAPPPYVRQYLRTDEVALAAVDLPADTYAIVCVDRLTGDFRYWYVCSKYERNIAVQNMARELGSFAAIHAQ
jgi:hypothetical protein